MREQILFDIFVSNMFAIRIKPLILQRIYSMMLEWWNGRHEGLKIP